MGYGELLADCNLAVIFLACIGLQFASESPETIIVAGYGAQARIGAAKYGQFSGRGSPCSEKPFSRAQEVVVSPLTIAPLRGFVPLDTEFRPATNIGQGKQASSFHEKRDEG